MPPYLAGRDREIAEFPKFLRQESILQNLILTGLRGVGKTVLLETLRPWAVDAGWSWAGADLSESATVTEEALARRLLTDLSVVTGALVATRVRKKVTGFDSAPKTADVPLDFAALEGVYRAAPGLVSDKLKAALLAAWSVLSRHGRRGVVFAYDEAQNLADERTPGQFPLSVLLDVFQSLQRQGARYLLVLTGLPTLFPKLVEARTYSERMFHVLLLTKLSPADSRAAIVRPTETDRCPVSFTRASVDLIVEASGGYPYFLQFISRELFDVYIEQRRAGERMSAPIGDIVRKLDQDFFAGRWARVTDRQRDLLILVARLDNADDEFTVQELVAGSREGGGKPFSPSHASQILSALIGSGLVCKNRHGKYSFAVPLFGSFIRRQAA
jgi:hypothetical protein